MLGAILGSPLTRVIPIGMTLLALQKTLFIELTPFGVIVQVVMAFAASAGVSGGFCAGGCGSVGGWGLAVWGWQWGAKG